MIPAQRGVDLGGSIGAGIYKVRRAGMKRPGASALVLLITGVIEPILFGMSGILSRILANGPGRRPVA